MTSTAAPAIRPATAADLPVIADIYRRTAESAPAAQTPFWERLLVASALLVAETDGEVIGFGTLDVTAAEQIRHLYVASSHQGNHVGAKLLAALEALASQGGLAEIRLHAAPGAVAFYRRAGYNPIAPDEATARDHDGVMMRKTLPRERRADA